MLMGELARFPELAAASLAPELLPLLVATKPPSSREEVGFSQMLHEFLSSRSVSSILASRYPTTQAAS